MTCFLLSATRIRFWPLFRYFILVPTAVWWIIALENFLALRSPIAFRGTNPCRKCSFSERGVAALLATFYYL
jgi:hypothetical protein